MESERPVGDGRMLTKDKWPLIEWQMAAVRWPSQLQTIDIATGKPVFSTSSTNSLRFSFMVQSFFIITVVLRFLCLRIINMKIKNAGYWAAVLSFSFFFCVFFVYSLDRRSFSVWTALHSFPLNSYKCVTFIAFIIFELCFKNTLNDAHRFAKIWFDIRFILCSR